MRRLITPVSLLSLCLAAQFSLAADALTPGSKAPAITVGKWLKGKPVANVGKGMYVVEFWATWCGPCRESIPHLTEMAKKQPKVTFVGVSVWEDTTPVADVQKFVDEMGAKMDYNVTVDSNKFMATNWMTAAKQNGIPTAFLVKDGVIQWIGHPMELEKPLGELVAGKFNLKQSQTAFAAQMVEREEEAKFGKRMAGVQKLLAAGKASEATAELDKIDKEFPKMKDQTVGLRKVAQAISDPAKAKADMDADIAAGKFEEVSNALMLYPASSELPKYGALKLLASDGAKSVIVDYNIINLALRNKDKALALSALDAADKAVPGSKFDNDQIKKMFAEMRKNAEALK